jgi:penicillin-binding protein 1B
MVGGRDFSRSQFNRATRSQRQPGSAFKPFVYLTAIDAADAHVTSVSRLRDEPLNLRVGRDVWSPTNYDGEFHGDVTVRRALEQSRNVPTVVLAQHIGVGRVAQLAQDVGLGRVPSLPAIVLGSAEVSLVDLTGAYTVFPKLGEVVRPALIRAVVGPEGDVLYRDELRSRRVATSAGAFVVSTLLEGVVDRGTAASIRRLGIQAPVAGKTGTTNEEKDSWFVGYSPDLVAGVWVGFDDATPVGLTGAEGALPIWAAFMKEALAARVPRRFTVPSGVVFRDVDPASGLLGGWMCPNTMREAFVVGSEPDQTCDVVAEARDLGPPPRTRGGYEGLPPHELEVEEAEPFPRRTRPPGGWKEVEGWFKGVLGGR